MGTASIVASVMTTYFGLKADIKAISDAQKTEERINSMRIKFLEDEIFVLQKQVDEIKSGKGYHPVNKAAKPAYPLLLSSAKMTIGR